MENDKNMIQLQNHVDNEVKDIVLSSMNNNGISLKSNDIDIILNEVKLDTQSLHKKGEGLYNDGDSKKELAEKLLTHVKDNKKKFKLLSKIADDLLKEGWCNKLDDK